MTKQWTTVQIPLSEGLDQKADQRASSPPHMDLLRNAKWEEVGGIQTRRPYASLGVAISTGGALTNIRRIVENGAELLCFTKDSLYSWNPTQSWWVLKATHLAAKIAEQTVFADAGDQVDADRAELNGTVFYSWTGSARSYVAAVNKATGAVMLPPTLFSPTGGRARLVPLATKVLLFFEEAGACYAWSFDPAAPDVPGATTVLASGIASTAQYDICQVGTSDTAILAMTRTVTTSYSLVTITASLAVTAVTKGRTSDGAIAISVAPGGTQVQVIRSNGVNIRGDLITISGFADVYTDQVVGTTPGAPVSMTACHRTVQDSGAYRCYAFWEYGESQTSIGDWQTQSNWVSTGNTLGSAVIFKRRWAPRARAFDRDGRVYVWGAFFGRTLFQAILAPNTGTAVQQSTYFLLRDDGEIVSKAAAGIAGAGVAGVANDGKGWTPGCQDIGGGQYAFAGLVCRVIQFGANSTDFAARSPREVIVTFDSNDARRTARIGQTLYVAGSEILQYDGTRLVEVGFHYSPWFVYATGTAGAAPTPGTYAYKFTWRAGNARGEVERSSAICVGPLLITSASAISLFAIDPLYITHRQQVAWEAWRTTVNPTADAPFYLVTSKDPATTANPNRFVFNDTTATALTNFIDGLTDALASVNETNPENGGYLESVPPPSATIIIASADRLFLAGIAGLPNTVQYSKLRGDGEVASFNDALTVNVPATSGAITGLAFLNETLIAFTPTAIYALAGDGFDNVGGGQNYGPARMLANDVGAAGQESIALTPAGLVFKSRKGWYLLNRGWTADYIGAQVSAFDSDTVKSVHVVETQHQMRCLTDQRMLVFDYNPNPTQQWGEWTLASGVSGTMFGSAHYYATANDIRYQLLDHTGIDYGMDVELAWIKLNDLQGAGSVRWLAILGEYRGPCRVRIRLARDYQSDGAGNPLYYQDVTWTVSPLVIGGPLQVRIGPAIAKCQAIKVRITILSASGGSWSEAVKLTGLALEVGVDNGIVRRLPVAQKT